MIFEGRIGYDVDTVVGIGDDVEECIRVLTRSPIPPVSVDDKPVLSPGLVMPNARYESEGKTNEQNARSQAHDFTPFAARHQLWGQAAETEFPPAVRSRVADTVSRAKFSHSGCVRHLNIVLGYSYVYHPDHFKSIQIFTPGGLS